MRRLNSFGTLQARIMPQRNSNPTNSRLVTPPYLSHAYRKDEFLAMRLIRDMVPELHERYISFAMVDLVLAAGALFSASSHQANRQGGGEHRTRSGRQWWRRGRAELHLKQFCVLFKIWFLPSGKGRIFLYFELFSGCGGTAHHVLRTVSLFCFLGHLPSFQRSSSILSPT